MQLKPIRLRKIADEIIAQIEEQVIEGYLRPGSRLPSERELAETLGVSRGAVREALTALEMMGIVDVKSGEGTFIRETTNDSKIQALSLILLLEKDAFRDILEVRKILEVACAELAAQKASLEQLDKIARCLEEMKQELEQGKFSLGPDMQFHYCIAEASGNSLLLRLMNTISGNVRLVLRRTWPRRFTSLEEGMVIFNEHRKILEALFSRAPGLAGRYMEEHLNRVAQALEENEKWKEEIAQAQQPYKEAVD
ncbi:MAG: GntR family transcriptional regulator, transcriptional repressor for pyruvate dehydrogenase complex [Clostridia bacterium]|nr:GntR family transcriptional regulator, transcriptional repressor for pyruvate dehydrogenase complex [Clostridia bacterium]